MTVHAEAHRHIDISLRGALRRNVAVARRAFDLGSNVRRVIEPDVRLRRIPEHALPGEVAPLFAHLRDLPDARAVRRDGAMAGHAGPHARQSCDGPFGHRLVTVLGAGDFPARVNDVWELERLLDDNRMPAEEVIDCGSERRARRGEDFRRLSGEQLRRRRGGYVSFENTAPEAARQRQNQDQTEAREHATDQRHPHRGITSQELPAWVPCCE